MARSAAALGAREAFARRDQAVVRHAADGVAEAGIGRRISRVALDRALEVLERLAEAVGRPGVEEVAAAQVLLVGTRDRRSLRFRSFFFCSPVSFRRSASEICQAMSCWTFGSSLSLSRNCSPQSCDSVAVSTSSAWIVR